MVSKLFRITIYLDIFVSRRSFSKIDMMFLNWGTGGQEPGRIRAGDGREAGGDGSGCGSHWSAGGGRRMRDVKFFNDFLVPF